MKQKFNFIDFYKFKKAAGFQMSNNWYNYHKMKKETPLLNSKVELESSEHFNFVKMGFKNVLKESDKSLMRHNAVKYLYSRGLTDSDIRFYLIHYDPIGKYFGRVIVPFIENKRAISFVARTFINDEKRVLNPPGKKEIFNLQHALNYDELIICEGVFDAIATGKNAIAILGMFLSEYQLKKLWLNCKNKRIGIFLDSGELAYKNSLKLAKQLSFYFKDVVIYCLPKEFKDPGEFNAKNFRINDKQIPLKDIIPCYKYSEELYMKEMIKGLI